MEASSDFQQGRNATLYLDFSGGGLGYARENLQQSGFTGTIAANDAYAVTLVDLE
jgi:hypothetical protein